VHDEELQVLADELASWLSCREDDERDAALDVLEREIALLPDEDRA
jgi:DICT domain-containing protein